MTTQFLSLDIDTSQAIKQLEFLGYHRGDAVMSGLFAKEDPCYAPGTRTQS
ncbi:hypothetical protein [Nostoc sp. 'Peltigera malacea cyanobiont' DB3992]|uniref:hypothetical protein n=1 Tax=Nostoc sp. 'Peltigera malacea cyanobiont' DB3992 TaxID=1206980 RepID=UPI0015D4C933|nr:hypothetical protein [Nostoc sp. 'Peltigera malacea cyanobiont' DB3992]